MEINEIIGVAILVNLGVITIALLLLYNLPQKVLLKTPMSFILRWPPRHMLSETGKIIDIVFKVSGVVFIFLLILLSVMVLVDA